MDKTPKGKTRSTACKMGNGDLRASSPLIFGAESSIMTTPIQESKRPSADDYSPIFLLNAQINNNEVDVVWDFNSPHVQQPQRNIRRQKRVLLPQSPQPKLKKHPSNNQIQCIDHIKEEMEALRKQVLSNQALEETGIEDFNENLKDNNLDINCAEFLNDSWDDEMFLTPEVENEISTIPKQTIDQSRALETMSEQKPEFKFKRTAINVENNHITSNNYTTNLPTSSIKKENNNLYNCDSKMGVARQSTRSINAQQRFEDSCINNLSNCDLFNISTKKIQNHETTSDSIDQALAAFEDDDMFDETKTMQNVQYNVNNNLFKPASTLPEINRPSPEKQKATIPSKSVMDVIERKRQEALAKREAKLKEKIVINNISLGSALIHKYLHDKSNSMSPEKQVPVLPSKEVIDVERKRSEMGDTRIDMMKPMQSNTQINIHAEIERKRLEALAKQEAKRKQKAVNTIEVVTDTVDSKSIEEEIERKRLEALAKREAKLKQKAFNTTEVFNTDTIDPKSIQEEIERKRLEAVAKREAKLKQKAHNTIEVFSADTVDPKSIQEEIEMKRLEAIAKREARKKLNAQNGFTFDQKMTQNTITNSNYLQNNATNEHNLNQAVSYTNMHGDVERKRLEAIEKRNQNLSTNVQTTKVSPQTKCETPPMNIVSVSDKDKKELMERNRLEALRRLEQNKRKRALEMKPSLPRRTDYST